MRRRRLLDTLKPRGGTLLDVGCGTGDFLAVMRSRTGWRVSGLEPTPGASRYAREVHGLEVQQGELPHGDLPSRCFDVVTMWHVLEHVPDPAAILAEVSRLLKADGVLVIAIPVSDSLEAEWFGPQWAGYDVPRHLVTFSRSSLTTLARNRGFDLQEKHGVIQGLASVRVSLEFWLKQRGGLHARSSRAIAWLLMPPVFLALRLLGGRQSSVAVFVARLPRSGGSGGPEA
jgi:SAM-dependent methyltransferase